MVLLWLIMQKELDPYFIIFFLVLEGTVRGYLYKFGVENIGFPKDSRNLKNHKGNIRWIWLFLN